MYILETTCHINPLITKLSPKNTVFNWSISLFLATMTLNGLKFGYKIVQYFNSVYAHKPKFGLSLPLPVLNFFSLPFPFLFSALLLLLPFSLHILSGCRKKLGVNYGQSLEMDLDQL